MKTNIESWSPQQEMANIVYHTNTLVESWQPKAAFSIGLTAVSSIFSNATHAYENAVHGYASLFGGDPLLVRLLVILLFCDLVLSILKTIFPWKRQVQGWKDFARDVSKLPIYSLYVIIVAFIAVSLDHSLGWGLPLLNVFVAYLICCECRIILKNLEHLGVEIPPLLLLILNGVFKKFENFVQDKLYDGERRTNMERRVTHVSWQEEQERRSYERRNETGGRLSKRNKRKSIPDDLFGEPTGEE